MSVEGMWAIYFGDIDGTQVNSGVITLETGRIFGGDSFMAYLGTYSLSQGIIEGTATTWAYNPTIEVTTAFGKVGPAPTEICLRGSLDSTGAVAEIAAEIWETQSPELKLPARLVKIAELP